MLRTQFFSISFIITLVIVVIGCGSGESGPKLYTVSGTVTLDGQPIPDASILFKDPASKNKSYFANVKNGSFNSEMEAGKRRVLITANRQSKNKMVDNAEGTGKEPAMEQYLPSKYNEKSILEIEVGSNNENSFTFDLKSK
ncbi:hypothetical protein [Gimesia aquarii]|uniref:Carboxypeptidase regulatory-like domain-containing protein n=1 Tax=Gimesia aquarii TaxID=2527964 RepID=A0A517WY84_9PLAN|nr:hypothetical protein [Gimesia aquarii]QDU10210.1 hypothetical protein V202x_36090 [Gimesia aquarii]